MSDLLNKLIQNLLLGLLGILLFRWGGVDIKRFRKGYGWDWLTNTEYGPKRSTKSQQARLILSGIVARIVGGVLVILAIWNFLSLII